VRNSAIDQSAGLAVGVARHGIFLLAWIESSVVPLGHDDCCEFELELLLHRHFLLLSDDAEGGLDFVAFSRQDFVILAFADTVPIVEDISGECVIMEEVPLSKELRYR
jgi:hypothetical protein